MTVEDDDQPYLVKGQCLVYRSQPQFYKGFSIHIISDYHLKTGSQLFPKRRVGHVKYSIA